MLKSIGVVVIDFLLNLIQHFRKRKKQENVAAGKREEN